MLRQLLVALCLMAICVVVHAIGTTTAFRRLRRQTTRTPLFRELCWLFIRLAAWMVLLHLAEIALWGFFYVWRDAISDLPSAIYFSAVTYTTTGYGDLVLPEEWRLVGAVEALTGILMCGWSTAFFFAVVSRAFTATQPDPS